MTFSQVWPHSEFWNAAMGPCSRMQSRLTQSETTILVKGHRSVCLQGGREITAYWSPLLTTLCHDRALTLVSHSSTSSAIHCIHCSFREASSNILSFLCPSASFTKPRHYKCCILYLYFVFVLKGWSLLPNALRPFKIYCAPPNLGIPRTWI